MEIYRNEVSVVRHYPSVSGESVTATGAVQTTVYDMEGVEVYSVAATLIDNYYEAVIPPAVSATQTDFDLVWEYTIDFRGGTYPVEIHEPLRAGTAYAPLAQLGSMEGLEGLSPFELRNMERLVAGVIDVYCNQTFNRENGKAYVIQGQDSDQLALPKRIINLTDVEVLDDPSPTQSYSVLDYTTFDPDAPWTLRRKRTAYVGRSINPVSRYRFFKYPDLYRVSGDWGWNMVPPDVTRAATLLVQDYFCDDAKYREKFIDNIRAGDWRMEFRATGDETTGNANADMLLTGYRNVAMAVI
ncbi:MAG: hypothetical protein LC650_00930 [Actinobacteria bacterium]|nr:hypothetical protein [Actinomycetota bacterium]